MNKKTLEINAKGEKMQQSNNAKENRTEKNISQGNQDIGPEARGPETGQVEIQVQNFQGVQSANTSILSVSFCRAGAKWLYFFVFCVVSSQSQCWVQLILPA